MVYMMLLLSLLFFGAYGYWRGAIRYLLLIAPFFLASLFAWFAGPMLFRIDSLRHAGLFWPLFIPMWIGFTAGVVPQFLLNKKLPQAIGPRDRGWGIAVGAFVSFFVVWLGCISVIMRTANDPTHQPGGSTLFVAKGLNSAVVQWIPGVGSGSDTLMNLVEISTAPPKVREAVIQEMRMEDILEHPIMQEVLLDDDLQQEVKAAASGSIGALWRLQTNPSILKIFDSPELMEAFGRYSLDDIADAVRTKNAEGTQR